MLHLQCECSAQFLHYSPGMGTCDHAMTPTNGGWRPSFALPKVALPLRIMQRSALTFWRGDFVLVEAMYMNTASN